MVYKIQTKPFIHIFNHLNKRILEQEYPFPSFPCFSLVRLAIDVAPVEVVRQRVLLAAVLVFLLWKLH